MMSSLIFKRKPMPVIPDHRPMYKLSFILLILNECSIGGKSSLLRLHLFNWAMKEKKRTKLLLMSAENKNIEFDIWGMDPTVNFALNHGVANGLISKIGTGYKISNKGVDFLTKYNIKEEFNKETEIINKVKKTITQKMVDEVALRWKNEA
ncbi:hypothetical protein AB4166_02370 [Vibrio splendidus]